MTEQVETSVGEIVDEQQPEEMAMVPVKTLHHGVAGLIEIKRQVERLVTEVLKPGIHFGKVPGTNKYSLFKAGSEALFVTLGYAVDHEITDLAEDVGFGSLGEIRYRVVSRARHIASGLVVAEGVGECSSNEEKYRWRAAVCAEEWENTDPELRRIKYRHKRGGGGYESIQQIATNPSDHANTVLKMAKKRADVDCALAATAASDVFTQDVEDLPDYVQDEIAKAAESKQPAGRPQPTKPQPRQSAAKSTPQTPPPNSDAPAGEPEAQPTPEAIALCENIPQTAWDDVIGEWHDRGTISEAQCRRLYAIASNRDWTGDMVNRACEAFLGVAPNQLPWGRAYETAVEIFQTFDPVHP